MAWQVVMERAVVRSNWQLDSEKLGEMETGEELVATESVTHPQVSFFLIRTGIIARNRTKRLHLS